MRRTQKLEKLVGGHKDAKEPGLLGAVVGSDAFLGCLMAGMRAYPHVWSVVKLLCDTCWLVLL